MKDDPKFSMTSFVLTIVPLIPLVVTAIGLNVRGRLGSGTTVREDVPSGALGVSAGKQRNIPDWAKARKPKA